ncbi:MAG: LysR family transcriptional regulator [Salinarimonadaceae bacterium]|nr:MAG: LysR family transcriptional regulator [Salinarimonadaceae bacterium]
MSRFDWDDLRFFLAVARVGRLTVAARRLGADHATVSRRITALEDALKAKLFERRPQGYALTEHGERLLSKAEAIETQALAVSSEIGGADLALSGTVRIGAPDGFGTMFLAPRTASLGQQYPDLEMQIVAMPRLLSLSKREADIAISLAPPKEGKIVARRLTDYKLGVFATQEYIDTHKRIEEPEDMLEHTFIGYIDDLIFTPELDYLDEISKGIRAKLQSSSLVAQMQAALAGAGVCILPYYIAATEPNLVQILPERATFTRSYWLIVHADLKDIARIRATMDFLVREVKSARQSFLPDDRP